MAGKPGFWKRTVQRKAALSEAKALMKKDIAILETYFPDEFDLPRLPQVDAEMRKRIALLKEIGRPEDAPAIRHFDERSALCEDWKKNTRTVRAFVSEHTIGSLYKDLNSYDPEKGKETIRLLSGFRLPKGSSEAQYLADLQEFDEFWATRKGKRRRKEKEAEPKVFGKCPRCGSDLVKPADDPKAKYVVCSNDGECSYSITINHLKKSPGLCPECGDYLIFRVSRNGSFFYGCHNYPSCTHTEAYKSKKE